MAPKDLCSGVSRLWTISDLIERLFPSLYPHLDRVVAIKTEKSGTAMHRREFQLVAVTCLYLAIKLHGETDVVDGPRRKLKINAFVELSRGLFTVETLEAKEREILEMLEWKVNPPTTVRIVATLLHLLPEWTVYDQPAHPNTAKAIYEISRILDRACCLCFFFLIQLQSIRDCLRFSSLCYGSTPK
jgi:hypothetical protein